MDFSSKEEKTATLKRMSIEQIEWYIEEKYKDIELENKMLYLYKNTLDELDEKNSKGDYRNDVVENIENIQGRIERLRMDIDFLTEIKLNLEAM